VYQAVYNAIYRSIEAELLPACCRYGLEVVVYNPIAGGLFNGKVESKDMVPAEGRFSYRASYKAKVYYRCWYLYCCFLDFIYPK
jgi:aflatoxin B1 aldehyde reductase